MRIIVCIKQVPGSSNVEVDPVTGTMKRDGVAGKMNPYDLYSLEAALSLADTIGAEVYTVTMGPPQAKAIIEEAVCMGAAGGAVLSDRKFAGADVLATAYTLSEGIRKCGGYDLIFCGKQTTDGDTAQVGAEVAEYLGLPNVACVRSIDKLEDGAVYVTVTLDDRVEQLRIALPCVLSMDGDINSPRLPSYKIKKTLTDDRVTFFGFSDLLDNNEKHYGQSGSATQVERIFPPEKNTEKRSITGTSAEQADGVFSLIKAQKLV